MLKVGDKAPDFTLPDTDLKPRSLKEFLVAKTVLAFFVGAFTSVCTKEMCTFRDSMARLIDLEAQIVGIAVTDPFSNKAFSEKNRLTFPILSDYKREVIKAYGIELPHFAGLRNYTTAKRAIFILDNGGIVRYRWVANDQEDEPKYREIEEFLAKMQRG
ncbi:redoxin domain-containing protein [Candidatus Bathyarchaeota archaeon]|nr:redoxin domain-containing protein [Candidatus Bathyarchaeota archaeon]